MHKQQNVQYFKFNKTKYRSSSADIKIFIFYLGWKFITRIPSLQLQFGFTNPQILILSSHFIAILSFSNPTLILNHTILNIFENIPPLVIEIESNSNKF